MIVESRTLARSCYENVYVLSALKRDGEVFVKAMVADEMHARKTGSRWILNLRERTAHVDSAAVENIRANLAHIEAMPEGTVRHRYDRIAERAGVGEPYIFYKQLSWDAAHPSPQALSRYLPRPRRCARGA